MGEGAGVSREERLQIGRRRIRNILASHTVASMRTLEQKISDAGPNPQRVDPHLLTLALQALVREQVVSSVEEGGSHWYYLSGTPPDRLASRLGELLPIYRHISAQGFKMRLGQTLEIAIFKTLSGEATLAFFGAFPDLEDHGDERLYRKEEPPAAIGNRRIPNDGRFDFLYSHSSAGFAGIEAKNVRPWMYPDRPEVRDLLRKCIVLDAIPVLIARRIHYSTFSVLGHCGVLLHQVYNQLFPAADRALAELAADKKLLGYHDVRVGNDPDSRMRKFLLEHLPSLLPGARASFGANKDLVEAYALGRMPYLEFAARVKRRSRAEPEDARPFTDEEIV